MRSITANAIPLINGQCDALPPPTLAVSRKKTGSAQRKTGQAGCEDRSRPLPQCRSMQHCWPATIQAAACCQQSLQRKPWRKESRGRPGRVPSANATSKSGRAWPSRSWQPLPGGNARQGMCAAMQRRNHTCRSSHRCSTPQCVTSKRKGINALQRVRAHGRAVTALVNEVQRTYHELQCIRCLRVVPACGRLRK